MANYRLYAILNGQRGRQPLQVISAANDIEAIEAARLTTSDSDTELWDGDRIIMRFPVFEPSKASGASPQP